MVVIVRFARSCLQRDERIFFVIAVLARDEVCITRQRDHRLDAGYLAIRRDDVDRLPDKCHRINATARHALILFTSRSSSNENFSTSAASLPINSSSRVTLKTGGSGQPV